MAYIITNVQATDERLKTDTNNKLDSLYKKTLSKKNNAKKKFWFNFLQDVSRKTRKGNKEFYLTDELIYMALANCDLYDEKVQNVLFEILENNKTFRVIFLHNIFGNDCPLEEEKLTTYQYGEDFSYKTQPFKNNIKSILLNESNTSINSAFTFRFFQKCKNTVAGLPGKLLHQLILVNAGAAEAIFSQEKLTKKLAEEKGLFQSSNPAVLLAKTAEIKKSTRYFKSVFKFIIEVIPEKTTAFLEKVSKKEKNVLFVEAEEEAKVIINQHFFNEAISKKSTVLIKKLNAPYFKALVDLHSNSNNFRSYFLSNYANNNPEKNIFVSKELAHAILTQPKIQEQLDPDKYMSSFRRWIYKKFGWYDGLKKQYEGIISQLKEIDEPLIVSEEEQEEHIAVGNSSDCNSQVNKKSSTKAVNRNLFPELLAVDNSVLTNSKQPKTEEGQPKDQLPTLDISSSKSSPVTEKPKPVLKKRLSEEHLSYSVQPPREKTVSEKTNSLTSSPINNSYYLISSTSKVKQRASAYSTPDDNLRRNVSSPDFSPIVNPDLARNANAPLVHSPSSSSSPSPSPSRQ